MDRLVPSLAVTCLSTTVFVLTAGAQAQDRGNGNPDERAIRAAEALQQRADRYELGVTIRSVDVAAVEPPPEVA